MQIVPLYSINWWEGIATVFEWAFAFGWFLLKMLLIAWPLWLLLGLIFLVKLLFIRFLPQEKPSKAFANRNDGHQSTYYARLLHDELKRRGVESILEYNDGHKNVDLAILPAKLYIEVDGIQHLTNPDQIKTDFIRDYYSQREGFFTLRLPNEILQNHLGGITDAIVEIASNKK